VFDPFVGAGFVERFPVETGLLRGENNSLPKGVLIIMNKKALRSSVVNRLFVAWAACEIFICSAAFAAPIPAGLDSFETLYGSEQNFNNGPIPADSSIPGLIRSAT
jgi:hypothetical protein